MYEIVIILWGVAFIASMFIARDIALALGEWWEGRKK